jgi:diguanylate cyclase (GGDEF)-like protein
LGRYGGEEFLIVLPGCSPNDAYRLANRVRNSICFSPAQTSAGPIPFTISLGVASSADLKDDLPSGLIHAADQALYEAKRNGRNHAEMATMSPVAS